MKKIIKSLVQIMFMLLYIVLTTLFCWWLLFPIMSDSLRIFAGVALILIIGCLSQYVIDYCMWLIDYWFLPSDNFKYNKTKLF